MKWTPLCVVYKGALKGQIICMEDRCVYCLVQRGVLSLLGQSLSVLEMCLYMSGISSFLSFGFNVLAYYFVGNHSGEEFSCAYHMQVLFCRSWIFCNW